MKANPSRHELFRLMVENAGEEIFLVRPDGSLAYVNHAAAAGLGYTVDELLAVGLGGIDSALSRERFRANFDAVKAGELSLFEVVHVTKDGRERVKELKTVYAQLGGDEFVITFSRDITDRKAFEASLRESELRFRTLVESLPSLAVQCVDRTAKIVYWNEASERLYGYSAAEACGQFFYEMMVGPEQRPRVLKAFQQWMDGGPKMADGELDLIHRDGHVVHVYSNRARLRNSRGEDEVYRVDIDLTPRLQAEEALRRKDEQFRRFVENLQDVIVVIGADGRIRYESPSIRRVLGLDPEEREGQDAFEFVHPEDRPVLKAFGQKLLSVQGPLPPFSLRFLHRDGTYRLLEAVGTNLLLEPAVQGIVFNLRDVTERNRVERALAESERLYRLLYERNLSGVYRSSTDGRVLECNLAFARILGCESPEEVKALPAEAFYVEPADRAAFLEAIGREGAVTNFRERLRARDGREVTILLNANLIREGEGEAYIEGTLLDITELEQATEALRRSERRLKNIVEHSTNLFYSHTAGHVLTYVSPQSRAFFDCEPDEALVRWTEFVTDNPVNALGFEATQRAIDTGVRQPAYELELRTRLGRTVWVEVNEAPVVRDGKTHSIVGALTDITARKRAEAEAAGLQARLQQSQKLESLGILAGGISHDFNNLLVGILGNADLALMDGTLPAPVRHRVEEVRMAAIRASELTSHMLAYSGQGQLSVQLVDLSALVEEMAVLMEASMSRKAALRYSFGKELPAVEGDPVQLRQVVMNLILNASESLGEKSGLIQMGTSLQEMTRGDLDQTLLGAGLAPGPFVSLTVSDTGCGMDPETQERIFDPFYTTKRSGRGLGLAVVLGIVRSHRGTIRVFSEVGRGSRFEVCFPAAAGTAVPDAKDAEDEIAPQPGAGAVLLVDDDPAVREVASAMLEGLGYAVVAVAGGREALAHAAAEGVRLDAVLLDLALGEMDGDEVLKALRVSRPSLPVILLTGRAPREVEQRLAGLPVDGVLRKPFRRADLVKALRAVIRP